MDETAEDREFSSGAPQDDSSMTLENWLERSDEGDTRIAC